MKVVIDCNVIISAGLTDGVCRQVILHALENYQVIVTEAILAEYKAVAVRDKFAKAKQLLLELIVIIEASATEIADQIEYDVELPDPKDLVYIHAAINAQAQYLVTGNIKDFPSLTYKSVKVISPKQLLSL